MQLSFFNPFLITISLFLLIYAFGFMPFPNAIAAGFSLGVLLNIFYPHIRGVRKGDIVSVVRGPGILGAIFSTTATALGNGKKGDIITVIMEDGSERKAVILNYAGIFSMAEVKIIRPPKVISPHPSIEIH